MDSVKPRILATGRYAINVEPIPPRNRNNREVHLDYLKHLKECVETLRKIVEEAKVERPLDSSLAFACLYTKHSQELVYYVEGLGHNLFSVEQFCDSDLEVAFRKHSCYVRDTDGVELIKDKFRARTQSVPYNTLCTPKNKELDILFQPMFNEYLEPQHVERPVSPAPTVPVPVNSADTPSSTTVDQDAPSPSHSL
ncbi:hypothetical protein Tco_1070351 [Tanacetum coccineum]|uniref:Uncharacterized protein n=1 Tax=Tanacetum coccineum TaxID=301880 RepID=A0ABQ5HMJ4_9ASTR